jgi:branched-chain amino acid transport system permease protein
VNANTYIIFVSLALVMLTVVGGIGSVAGALMGGILAGTAFEALTSTFTNLSTDHGGGGVWNVLANISLVAPALIGISLGRNPSGAVPQIVASYRPLWQVKWVLAFGVVVEGLFYVLTLTQVMGNWWFVLATGVVVLLLPLFGRAVRPEVFGATAGLTGMTPERATPAVQTPEAIVAIEGVADARS